ncbi:MAG: hypothetical protein COW02_10945 [Comamonadaceae bacterium CG12_big_fil_rev_8_21_14_0_65_59_15]|nr:MAG: hypothetical protein COW02_10945 [Comamonadaceae bacterium CG12_big_fil_rev_8_21_14_0_65_59_15]
MKTGLKLTLIGTLLAVAGLAYSQGPMGWQHGGQYVGMQGMRGMQQERMGGINPTQMQARFDARNAELKAQLKITAEQEAAWNAYTEAMKPAASMMNFQRPDPAEMAKLTTPERLDKMQQLRAQRMGDMFAATDKHVAATKALYAALTPEQQKTFDAAALPGECGAGGHQYGPRQHMWQPA